MLHYCGVELRSKPNPQRIAAKNNKSLQSIQPSQIMAYLHLNTLFDALDFVWYLSYHARTYCRERDDRRGAEVSDEKRHRTQNSGSLDNKFGKWDARNHGLQSLRRLISEFKRHDNSRWFLFQGWRSHSPWRFEDEFVAI